MPARPERCGHGVLTIITDYGDREDRYQVTCSLVAGHRGQHIGRQGDHDKTYDERDVPPAEKIVNLGGGGAG